MTSTANDLQIANTIRQQIGNRACVMMGASNFVGGSNYLTFKIGSNCKRVTHITITLDPCDTYTVKFQRVTRKYEVIDIAEFSDVYVDSLHTLIESNTGLYLSL